ncbi:hypothetical protein L6164_005427 [Bauhinia variegata]|nr:hypothetical protein L6164_005427 [Bauhinia variegata]
MEFIIETDTADLLQRTISPVMVICYITQDTQKHPLLPELKSGGFWVMGKVSTLHCLSDPINGGLTVETSAIPIHSIDIHLLRVESILLGEKFVTETSLIQTSQIADGDVCRNLTLPICDTVPSFDMSNNLSWSILNRVKNCHLYKLSVRPIKITNEVRSQNSLIVGKCNSNLSLVVHVSFDFFSKDSILFWQAATGFCLTIFILNFQRAMETLPLELVRTK